MRQELVVFGRMLEIQHPTVVSPPLRLGSEQRHTVYAVTAHEATIYVLVKALAICYTLAFAALVLQEPQAVNSQSGILSATDCVGAASRPAAALVVDAGPSRSGRSGPPTRIS